MPRAYVENVFYRLFLFSVLAYLISTIWRSKNRFAKPVIMIVAMTVAQIINIWINVVLPSGTSLTLNIMIYDAVRYIAPGVCWALIYWKYGFSTAEIASVGCHIFLQPMLGWALA